MGKVIFGFTVLLIVSFSGNLNNKFFADNSLSECGNQIFQDSVLKKFPVIGDRFIDFEMEDVNGNVRKLSDLKAKIILLEFWAAWCGPCRKENPALVKTYNKFNEKGFEIFAVSLDEYKGMWFRAIERDHLPWIHVSDLKGVKNEANLIYGVKRIPDNFLISKTGEIIGRDLRGEELTQKLHELLE